MGIDQVFSMPPASMSPAPAAPGSAIAPELGVDTSTGVGYISSGNGWVPQVPGTVTNLSVKGKAANIANATLYAVPANMGGAYSIATYVKVTTAATSNSTLPSLTIFWTDAADNTVQNLVASATNTTNTTGLILQNTLTIYASGGTNIIYNANGYLSNGTPLAYEVQMRCTYLG
jgi:hypothetical protein